MANLIVHKEGRFKMKRLATICISMISIVNTKQNAFTFLGHNMYN
jgi:hypothetical protein